MADELNDKQVQDQKSVEPVDADLEKDEQSQEEIPEKKEEVSEETDKQSFLDRMKDKIFGKKEEAVETKVEEDIPDAFTDVARKQGWNDKDITEFAKSYTNDELKKLIPYLAEQEEESKDADSDEKEVKPIEDEKDLKTLEERVTKSLEAKYQEKINELEERLGVIDKDRSVKEVQRFQTTADKFFDGAAKDFPVFGKTEELSRFPKGTKNEGRLVPSGEAFESRNKVWQTATAFYKMGLDWESSLSEALDWYKGKTMETDTRSKVLKELKKNEKRLSPKRTEHSAVRKFADEADEKQSTIEDIARRTGLNV